MEKRILFIITQSEFGGAQRFLSSFATKLDPQLYKIMVATGSTGDKHFTDHLNNINIPNVTLQHLVREARPWHDLRAIIEIKKLIADFRPDTLFLLSTKAGFLGSWAARNKNIKIIYRIGGWAFNDPQSKFRRWLILQAERIAARWKDVIILNNQHDLDQAQRLRILPRKQLTLIHNGLDVYKMKFLDKDKAREKLGIPNGIVVGTIANNYPTKGLAYLIKAAEAVSCTFVIIGNGTKDLPAGPNVMLLGRIPEASKYLPAFDIFVSPSVKEGFQWAVLEAMAAKVPVIATTVGATTEIIENGKNGFLVEPRKPERIVDCLHKLMADEHLRQEFGIQGHQSALHTFDLETMVRNTTKLL